VLFSSRAGFSSGIAALLPVTPKRIIRREVWSQSDFEELASWHAQGVQVWCVTDMEDRADAEFETALGVYGLPFRKHLFKPFEYAVYCVPSGPGTFAPPEGFVTRVPLGAGNLRGWFEVDRSNPGVGMGITHLAVADHPCTPIFAGPGLALRSVLYGRGVRETWPWDVSSRAAVAEVRLPSAACAEARWPFHAGSVPLDCSMRYAFSGRNAVDMAFEVTPRGGEGIGAPLTFAWVCPVRGVCTPAIHFPGVRDGAEGWVAFGESDSERGVVAGEGLSEKDREQAGAAPGVCFSEPVYYGLVDGDQNDATDGDMTAFILMFDHPGDTRFVLRDSKNDSRTVEWDWQWVVQNPEPGRTYSQRARLVYKPFQGADDVLAEYSVWRDNTPPKEGSAAVARVPALSLPGPDGEECDLLIPPDRLAEPDPKGALYGYAALLEAPLYRMAAAARIDDYYMRFGDHAGLAAQWESIAARDTLDALPWSRLGQACYRMGDLAKADNAFSLGVGKEDINQECRTGLMVVRFEQGRIGDGAALAEAAVAACPGLAPRVAGLCAAAGRARFAAGDALNAEVALQAAVRFAPGGIDSRLLLGRLISGRGDTEQGMALFDACAAERPDLGGLVAETCASAAQVCLGAGNAPGAVALLRRCTALLPGDSRHRVKLAEALASAGDDGGAMTEGLKAFGETPEAADAAALVDSLLDKRGDQNARLDFWRRFTDAHPEAAVPRVYLGMALAATGDGSGAEVACRAALQRDPRNAAAKLRLGGLLAARGELGEGLAQIAGAAAVRPELSGPAAEACAAAANACMAAGHNDDAVAAFRQARSLAPKACLYSLALGGALETAGDRPGAGAAYGEALQCDPELVPAKIRLGALLLDGGDCGRGFALLDEAVAAQADTAGLAAEACAGAAGKRMDAGDAPGAAAALRHAIAFTPGVAGYRASLAAALEAAGDRAGALAACRAVVDAVPESPKSSARIDALLDAEGGVAARAKVWAELAARHADAAVPQLHLGLALEASGDLSGARASVEKALKINPDLGEARSALARLDNAQGNGKQ